MKIGVVTFPGSNCDMDMVHAMEHDLQFDVVQLWHKNRDLEGADIIVLPGGFSYGDYLRSGAIARFSPIMEAIVAHAQRGGRVFGVCNGFQILCESGLLPGALLHNESRKFICRNVQLKAVSRAACLSRDIDSNSAITIPIAHGEGNYFIDDDGLKKLQDQDQILFRYCDENGKVNPWSNPNGSTDSIAGVANDAMNVFGMMPHPERAASSDLGNTDGAQILAGLAALIEA
ncbi:MAG: phosphoribosylformylglycinamidine synthase subunit PurQ [Flavobacteriales bacterium]|nr:phosphoribosylformylglycinamidine synthase subunit PurQ [Flavobacteriales bacterium]